MFKLVDMEDLSKIIGIEILWGKDSITISQTYVESILQKAGMEWANTIDESLSVSTSVVHWKEYNNEVGQYLI